MSKVLRYDEHGNAIWVDKRGGGEAKTPRPIVSDALGCIADQVDELRADAQLHGFSGVDFKPDPALTMNGEKFTGYYQCHCSSPDQWAKYVEHRGYADINSRNGSGGIINERQMQEAQQLALRKYPKASNK